MVEYEKDVLSHKYIPYLFGGTTVISCGHPTCYTILHRSLHRHSENVKTVHVSGNFGIIRSTELPLIEMLLHMVAKSIRRLMTSSFKTMYFQNFAKIIAAKL